jgi:hypothetical protein
MRILKVTYDHNSREAAAAFQANARPVAGGKVSVEFVQDRYADLGANISWLRSGFLALFALYGYCFALDPALKEPHCRRRIFGTHKIPTVRPGRRLRQAQGVSEIYYAYRFATQCHNQRFNNTPLRAAGTIAHPNRSRVRLGHPPEQKHHRGLAPSATARILRRSTASRSRLTPSPSPRTCTPGIAGQQELGLAV